MLTVDSHIESCSEKISNLLGDSYNMTGITKPNANLEAITSPTDFNVDGYTKNDVLILSGGTVDIARNEINNGIRHVTHILNRTVNTTVTILDVPHHFDLINSSCVNKETIVRNRKLQKIRVVKTSNYMQIQNISRDRMCYTKHGKHMNSLGKNWMCQEITKKILDLLPKNDNLIIPLYWKATHSTDTTPHYSSNLAVSSLVTNQRPLRMKTPATRNEDFFHGLKSVIEFENKTQPTNCFAYISPKYQEP